MAYASYESSRIAAKRCYERRKSLGLCADCGTPNSNNKTRCDSCIAKHRDRDKRYREQGRCRACGKPSNGRGACISCKAKKKEKTRALVLSGRCFYGCNSPAAPGIKACERCNETRKARIRQTKINAFNAYGGAKCACCGESMLECLQLDHINNDGAEHRKMKMHGGRIYRLLRSQGYPPGFQVLCANCNFAKGILGYCPHQRFTATSSL